jgi:hypothetical protein
MADRRKSRPLGRVALPMKIVNPSHRLYVAHFFLAVDGVTGRVKYLFLAE